MPARIRRLPQLEPPGDPRLPAVEPRAIPGRNRDAPMIEWTTLLPRHAFSARDAARAGDLWRLFQEVAVEASTRCGWPPMRYREEGNAFVVRSVCAHHFLEAAYGEPLHCATWVSRMRREMFSTREIRVRSARGAISAARQEWVHVSASLQPMRAPRALLDAFPEETAPEGDLPVALPAVVTPIDPRPPHVFTFRAWWTWMDPLDHVNHPAYVDFCDEAIAIALRRAGLSPRDVVPIAEEATFRSGIVGDEEVCVQSVARGFTADGAVVIGHRISVGDRLCATLTTVRRLLGEQGKSQIAGAIAGTDVR
jgi:acyl-CoA thioesterase FadM